MSSGGMERTELCKDTACDKDLNQNADDSSTGQ